MKFYGRKKELAQLMKFISSDEMQMGLIYGRRRIGKSELVKQSIKESGIKSIFYECKQVFTDAEYAIISKAFFEKEKILSDK